MRKTNGFVRQFRDEEDAAVAIEYALIAMLISVAIIGVVTAMGTGTSSLFTTVNSELSKASNGSSSSATPPADRSGSIGPTRPGGDRGNRVPR